MDFEQNYHKIVRTRALCAPAIRMLLLSGWAAEETSGCSLIPIMAIESCSLEIYTSTKDKAPPQSLNLYELAEEGYHYQHSVDVCGEIFFFDGHLNSTLNSEGMLDFMPHEVVVCDWPKEEDETRLVESIKKLTAIARDNHQRSQRQSKPAKKALVKAH